MAHLWCDEQCSAGGHYRSPVTDFSTSCIHYLSHSANSLVTHLYVHPFIYLSTHPPLHPSIHPSVRPSIIHPLVQSSVQASLSHKAISPCVHPWLLLPPHRYTPPDSPQPPPHQSSAHRLCKVIGGCGKSPLTYQQGSVTSPRLHFLIQHVGTAMAKEPSQGGCEHGVTKPMQPVATTIYPPGAAVVLISLLLQDASRGARRWTCNLDMDPDS